MNASAINLTAAVRFDAAPAAGPRKFRGLAYSGERVADRNAVVDLASLRIAPAMPLLDGHGTASSTVIGRVTRAEVRDQALHVEGELFSHLPGAAQDISAKANAGLAWQMSG